MNDDLISRKAAIDALNAYEDVVDTASQVFTIRGCKEAITNLPSAQPERLTDDDFETIRIHLNAYKEKLCNQQRWKEADEYQRIIDRFMAFASAQPEIIRCKDCKHYIPYDWMFSGLSRSSNINDYFPDGMVCLVNDNNYPPDGFCSNAERRTDEGSD